MKKGTFSCFLLGIFLLFHKGLCIEQYDVVVYGGTSCGVIAAVQAARMRKSVVLIEPEKHLGGMTASGLSWIDVGNPATIGGLTREYFHRVWLHYQNDEAWRHEKKRCIKGQLKNLPENEVLWVLEPHVGEQIFEQMLAEARVPVLRGERLNRKYGVAKSGNRIVHLIMESGRTFLGRMFIDATYEGDLMAASGVSYTLGRESNSRYGETINGIHINHKRANIPHKLDPYCEKGNPKSGLLPRIHSSAGGHEGASDRGIQAYNYRMCLTNVPANRIKIEKPANYNELHYEIIFRAIEAGLPKEKFFKLDLIPNKKTDSNNHCSISTDYIGMNWDYPEADYAARKRIAREHETWQRGLLWTLQNHPRIPKEIKNYFAPWGLPKDEFTDNNHWPHQLYIREARRMIASVVITEHLALGKVCEPDGIGLGSYHLDSHAVKYFVGHDGYVMTDGGMYKKVPKPFPISYRAIVPKREQCENLVVPICLSATHAGYGSIRMEPVFMVLGQSSATAACLALERNSALQDLSYDALRKQLLKDAQIITWKKK